MQNYLPGQKSLHKLHHNSPFRLAACIALSMACIIASLPLRAQDKSTAPGVQWKTAYHLANQTAVVLTTDGGFLIGGHSYAYQATDARKGENYHIIKVDANGVKKWEKVFGGSGDDLLTALVATTDGGYLLGGTSSSGKSGDKSESSRGEKDYWIVKIDKDGNKLWDKTYGGKKDDELAALVVTKSGYLIGGSSASGKSGDKTEGSRDPKSLGEDYMLGDFWVVYINQQGIKQWDKTYGGNERDVLVAMASTDDGNFLIAGTSASGKNGDKSQPSRGEADYWVVKIASNGVKVWDKVFGGDSWDSFVSLVPAANGFLLAGTSHSNISGDKSVTKEANDCYMEPEEKCVSGHYWVVQIDNNGLKGWEKAYSKHNSFYYWDELGASIATADGGFILGGTNFVMEGDREYYILKTDSKGEIQWSSTGAYGKGYEQLCAVAQAKDGSYLFVGKSYDQQQSSEITLLTKTSPENTQAQIVDLTLINADTDQDIAKLNMYDEINLPSFSTRNFNIRANTSPGTVGSVVFVLNGKRYVENAAPYAIGGDNGAADYKPFSLPAGEYALSITPYSGRNGTGQAGAAKFVEFSVTDIYVTEHFRLVNTDTDRYIQSLENGNTLNLNVLPRNMTLEADVSPEYVGNIGSVVFEINGKKYIDNTFPYTPAGDIYKRGQANYQPFSLPAGNYVLKATPYTGTNGAGFAGRSSEIAFTVTDQSTVISLTLVNADNGQDIRTFSTSKGQTINLDLASLPTRNLNIRANTGPGKVGSVVFYVQGDFVRTENAVPYALGGDKGIGKYNAWQMPLGYYAIIARSFSQADGKGEAGPDFVLYVNITDSHAGTNARFAAVEEPSSPATAFPNPFTDKITVQVSVADGPVNIQVVDGIGRSYYQNQHQVVNGQTELDLAAARMLPGVYILQVRTQNQPQQIIKVIKQ